MRTTIDIDEALMRRALSATRLSTRKAVVEAGLRLLVNLHRQKAILALGGKIAWRGNLNALRQSRAVRHPFYGTRSRGGRGEQA